MPEVHWESCALAIEDVAKLLKEKFNNLSTEETVRLSNNIVRAVVRRVEDRK